MPSITPGVTSSCSYSSVSCTCWPGWHCPVGMAHTLGVLCPAGYFCAGNAVAPVRCGVAGYFCGLGAASSTQTPCQQGSFGLAGGNYTTSLCAGACAGGPGRYCPPASTSSSGVLCPDGYLCAGAGSPAVSCTGASGGTITFSGTYEVHTFTSNGSITFTGAVVGSALVVGGGGGGGSNLGMRPRCILVHTMTLHCVLNLHVCEMLGRRCVSHHCARTVLEKVRFQYVFALLVWPVWFL